MQSKRQRILELALESLENRKQRIDQEIADLRRQLRGANPGPRGKASMRTRKSSRFSDEERERRSARMKQYWEQRRKARNE